VVAWRNGTALVSISEVKLRWARLVVGVVTGLWPSLLPGYWPVARAHLARAIPSWVGRIGIDVKTGKVTAGRGRGVVYRPQQLNASSLLAQDL
jgi:hypothetical protein